MEQTMHNRRIGKKAFLTFLAIVILLSAVVETRICRGGPEWLYLVLMWIPALAATVANCVSFRENGEPFSLKKLFQKGGFRKCKLRYVLLGCLLPLGYLLIPYMVYWRLYPEYYAYHDVRLVLVLKDILPVMVFGILISLMSALGEEIGWRGFLVPGLQKKLGLNKTLLLSSLIWCCWHLPLLISGDYMSGTPLWYQLPAFALHIIPVGVMAGLLTLESGSVWPAAFLHAAHNNYDQAVFQVITRGDNRMYFVSETGVLTILCAWALAAMLYIHVKKQGKHL